MPTFLQLADNVVLLPTYDCLILLMEVRIRFWGCLYFVSRASFEGVRRHQVAAVLSGQDI